VSDGLYNIIYDVYAQRDGNHETVLLVIGDGGPDDLPAVQEKGPPSSRYHLCIRFRILHKFSVAELGIFLIMKADDLEPALHLNIAFMGKFCLSLHCLD
jgi:hypothetical protein